MATLLTERLLPHGVIVRPTLADDRQFLLHVYADSRAREMAQVPWNAEEIAAFLKSQFDLQDTQYRRLYPGAEFLVIEVDGKPAGRLYLCRFADRLQLMDIALLQEFRGRGIGSALMRAVQDRAIEFDLPVRLYVEQYNPARRLHLRMGFRTIGDQGLYELMEWQSPAQAGVAKT